MDWWDDDEDYQPGIAVFKGIKLDPFDLAQDHLPPATKTTPSPKTTANPKVSRNNIYFYAKSGALKPFYDI